MSKLSRSSRIVAFPFVETCREKECTSDEKWEMNKTLTDIPQVNHYHILVLSIPFKKMALDRRRRRCDEDVWSRQFARLFVKVLLRLPLTSSQWSRQWCRRVYIWIVQETELSVWIYMGGKYNRTCRVKEKRKWQMQETWFIYRNKHKAMK